MLTWAKNNMVCTTYREQNSRIFQGQITVFKDQDLLFNNLFNKSAFFDPILNALSAKTLKGVI